MTSFILAFFFIDKLLMKSNGPIYPLKTLFSILLFPIFNLISTDFFLISKLSIFSLYFSNLLPLIYILIFLSLNVITK